jgi:hypothetical protein
MESLTSPLNFVILCILGAIFAIALAMRKT